MQSERRDPRRNDSHTQPHLPQLDRDSSRKREYNGYAHFHCGFTAVQRALILCESITSNNIVTTESPATILLVPAVTTFGDHHSRRHCLHRCLDVFCIWYIIYELIFR